MTLTAEQVLAQIEQALLTRMADYGGDPAYLTPLERVVLDAVREWRRAS